MVVSIEKYFSAFLRKNKILSYIELGRPWNAVTVSLFALIGSLSSGIGISTLHLVILLLLPMLNYMASTAVNNYYGVDSDKINMPFAAHIEGRVTQNNILKFFITIYTVSLIISFFMGMSVFIMNIVFCAWGFLYSGPPTKFDRKNIFGTFWLGFGTVFIPALFGVVVATNTLQHSLTLFQFLITFSVLLSFIIIVKDFKDITGDKKSGKKTFAIAVGVKRATLISIAGVAVFGFLTILHILSIFGSKLAMVSTLFIAAILLIEIKSINEKEVECYEKLYSNIRIVLLMYLLFFIFYIFV